MKKSFLFAAFAMAILFAPATFAQDGGKKQTSNKEVRAQKKQDKLAAKTEKKAGKKMATHTAKHRHHKA